MFFSKRLWQRCTALSMTCLCLLIVFSGTGTTQGMLARTTLYSRVNGNIPVLTYKYDNQRAGENINEIQLNLQNVNGKQFGRLISYPVDGQIYAQPLYVPNVKMGATTHNLVFVVTERDSVYAFDADRTVTDPTPLWHTSFLTGDASLVSARRINCTDVTPSVGMTSTPVIDSATNTLFLVSLTSENNALTYKLHALDLATGHEKAGSPIVVHNPGFNSTMERQRAGLLLANGRIYLAFASFCDHGPYHGWIISYSYGAAGFHLNNAYNDTPTGKAGGIWSGGSAIAADQSGNIYALTGNGTFNLNQGGSNAGDSFLKFNPNLHLVDYFTPFNQSCLAAKDQDLGSGGPLITPGAWLIGGGKQGKLYVLDTHAMGHFRAIANPCGQHSESNLDPIQQTFTLSTAHAIFSTPVYWHGPDGEYVFVACVKDHTQAFKLSQGHLAGPVSATPEIFGYSGGNPVVSSNGSTTGTGILWTIVTPGWLRAYDATDLSHELYSANVGQYNKFVPPVVTNGKVFVATQDALQIYGLLASAPPVPPAPEQALQHEPMNVWEKRRHAWK